MELKKCFANQNKLNETKMTSDNLMKPVKIGILGLGTVGGGTAINISRKSFPGSNTGFFCNVGIHKRIVGAFSGFT